MRGVSVFDDFVGFAQARLHVSITKPQAADLVSLPPDHLVIRFVLGKVLVDERGVGLEGFQGVEDGRQFLVLDLDEIQGLLSGVVVNGGYGRDFVSDIPYLFIMEEGLVQDPLAVVHPGKSASR